MQRCETELFILRRGLLPFRNERHRWQEISLRAILWKKDRFAEMWQKRVTGMDAALRKSTASRRRRWTVRLDKTQSAIASTTGSPLSPVPFSSPVPATAASSVPLRYSTGLSLPTSPVVRNLTLTILLTPRSSMVIP